MKHSEINEHQNPSWLAYGCLLSPSDVQRTQGNPVAGDSVAWTLCGAVPEARKLLQGETPSNGVLELIRIASSPAGFRYLLVVHQIASWQHRWLLSMADARVHACLQDIGTGEPMEIALVGKDGEPFTWRSRMSKERAKAMRAHCSADRLLPHRPLAEDFARAAMELCSPSAHGTLQPGVDVTTVSVTAIPPEDASQDWGLFTER